jgi:iron complex outermembrane receptor protein
MLENYNWRIFETLSGEKGNLQKDYSEKRNPLNLFALFAWHFANRGTIETGLSYNFLKYSIKDHMIDTIDRSGKYKYRAVMSPFIGLNFPVKEHWHLYASAGHGFSYPTVEETLLPDGQANPNLKPESGINLETGIRINAFKNRLYTDVSAYILFVDNLLVTERLSEDIFTGKNAGKTRHMGFEFQSTWQINHKPLFLIPAARLNLSMSASDNQFTHFADNETVFDGNKLPGIPAFNLFTDIAFTFKSGIYSHFQFIHSGRQFLNDGNTIDYHAYSLCNLKLGYLLKSKRHFSSDFYFGTQNLFNNHYASMLLVNAPSLGGSAPRYYYPGLPRNFYAGISVNF